LRLEAILIPSFREFRYDQIERSGLIRAESAAMMDTRPMRGWETMPAGQRWLRLLAINSAAAAGAAILFCAAYRQSDPRRLFAAFVYSLVCANIIGSFILTALVRFGRRMYLRAFPWNWVLVASAIVVCTAAGSLLSNLLFLAFYELPAPTFQASFWLVASFATVIALVFGLGGLYIEVMRTALEVTALELRTRQLQEETARKCALEAQLSSLESHIRPHFLFNALNTVSSLISEDPKLAESLLGKIAALLRFSLDSNQAGAMALSAEIKAVRDYLGIESARLGERLRYSFEIAPDVETLKAPTFSLQTLVENSVRHAVASRIDGGAIQIRANADNTELRLEVEDDGPGFSKEAIRPGHGLDNLQRRLDALFEGRAGLEVASGNGRTVVRVRLPLARE
jgi:sensor histidine kinase YesM